MFSKHTFGPRTYSTHWSRAYRWPPQRAAGIVGPAADETVPGDSECDTAPG
jgi:hypothetical protein